MQEQSQSKKGAALAQRWLEPWQHRRGRQPASRHASSCLAIAVRRQCPSRGWCLSFCSLARARTND
eukprot:scaffold337419_cov21-Prasinocladus_malaysianus.AAC.1